LCDAEERWIDLYDAVSRSDFYNVEKGGRAAVDKFKKEVYQYTIDGVFVRAYESRAEAARVTGIVETGISHSTDVTNRSSGGFRWTSKRRKLPPFHHQRRRSITCFDLQGKKVRTFNPSVEASEFAIGTHKSNITACCKRKIKTAGGYKWRYSEDSSDVSAVAPHVKAEA
jgi:hypothetical protein